MSLITPVRTAVYHSAMPTFKAGMPSLPIKKDSQEQKKEKDKKHIPWGKIAIGALATAGFIEFIMRRNPAKKMQQKSYAEIFAKNTEHKPRDFMMLPVRDETLIQEALGGNKEAKRLFPTITPEAPYFVEYVRTKEKIARAEQYFIEGRFDDFKTDNKNNAQIQKEFFSHLAQLKKKAETLYQEHILPLVKF